MAKFARQPIRIALLAALSLAGIAFPAEAQYFGRNKVQYDKFEFRVLQTEHFDIHFYPAEADAAREVARMAERWHARLSRAFNHTLSGRQAVILYASHPEFEQTNVIEGLIDEGTGGVTESGRRRVVLPLAATLHETDHVLGHELVHAFQYDILGANAGAMPLWFIEGMAEYLSLGSRYPQTAMWLRDSAREDNLPKVEDLGDFQYFPYRFGHAFWAYIGGRWGDAMVGQIALTIGSFEGGPMNAPDPIAVIEDATGAKRDEISTAWHDAIRSFYGVEPRGEGEPVNDPEVLAINERSGGGFMNVGPSLSPDGERIAFLSEKSRLSIDLYVAETRSGRIIRKLTENAADPHFESLQFLASAGTWDPESRRLAVATVRSGKAVIAVFDTFNGDIVREIAFDRPGEIFQPTWSPDGQKIAFSAQVGGFTDLYVYDLGSGQTQQITSDAFADIQPIWSPDSQRLAFVTDRYSTDLGNLSFTRYSIAIIEPQSGKTMEVATGLSGNASNPQWTPDGNALVFVSDANGRPEVYRLNLAGASPTQLTNLITGVSGITPLSPAISVAAKSGQIAIGVFRDGGYEIRFLGPAAGQNAPTIAPARVDLAQLPPASRVASTIAADLQNPQLGLPSPASFTETDYKSGLSLVGVGQEIGVASSGTFGTYVSGGISFLFSDVLGNHLISATTSVNGGVKDIAAQISYINRTSRWNWGVFGEHVPLLSGTVRSGLINDGGNVVFLEEQNLFRQTNQQLGVMTAYPLSRSTRIEFSSALRHIGFGREVRERIFDPFTGQLLSDERRTLPAEESLNLAELSAAYVRDTAAFGAVSPVLGQRVRFDVTPSFGDLRMTTITGDYRQYVMPVRPLTLGARFLHAGRYGEGGEDSRLVPLFLGYSTLVRGYDVNSFEASECTSTLTGDCPEFDRLFGSRMIVTNFEARVPVKGLFNGELDYGPLPVELFGFFDAGVAWTKAERPSFADGPRDWIASTGFGARVNLLGFAIGEFNLARPLTREGRGWMFVFNLRPGF